MRGVGLMVWLVYGVVVLVALWFGYRVWLRPIFLRMEAGLIEERRARTAASYEERARMLRARGLDVTPPGDGGAC